MWGCKSKDFAWKLNVECWSLWIDREKLFIWRGGRSPGQRHASITCNSILPSDQRLGSKNISNWRSLRTSPAVPVSRIDRHSDPDTTLSSNSVNTRWKMTSKPAELVWEHRWYESSYWPCRAPTKHGRPAPASRDPVAYKMAWIQVRIPNILSIALKHLLTSIFPITTNYDGQRHLRILFDVHHFWSLTLRSPIFIVFRYRMKFKPNRCQLDSM